MTVPFDPAGAPAGSAPARRACARCGTELAPSALVCPACHALVHADRLRLLAAQAEAHLAAGRLHEARAAWDETLPLLPADSQQHAAITAKLTALVQRITDASPAGDGAAPAVQGPWYKRWAAGAGAVLLLVLTKGKFLLAGLTKLPTFASMFAFFGVYWAAFGWPLALGLVLGIYVHEMGHVYAILRLGGKPSAPMFIPGIGAFVSWAKRVSDPREDAYVGLAGPIWGAGAGLVAFGASRWTGADIWLAIASLTGMLNLFNLMPFFGLDGSHGFAALSRPQRIAVVATMGVALWLSGFKLLVLVAAVAAWRCFDRQVGPGDARTLANFVGLVAVLSWMATLRPL